MLFHSLEFFFFACLFFLFWSLARERQNLRCALLVVASFIFYGWWDWKYLFLILLSGSIDYWVGRWIVAFPHRKRMFLLLSIAGNLGILFSFKYLIWGLETAEQILGWAGHSLQLVQSVPAWIGVLPVGLSFYTFQSMSYTFDVYKGKLKPTHDPLLFFSYLSMFPQLVAGPIVRASDIFDQLRSTAPISPDRFYSGFRLIVQGLFKKVVVADNLAPFVDEAFAGAPGDYGIVFWWLAVTGFAIQIYCDFSGYTDIARGLAKWMGLDFRKNFNYPYLSMTLKEFWTRWHISLSSWFRDYVYVPLGGSRRSEGRKYFNLWITMLLSGLWHGAGWTFVVWGGLHALFVSAERRFARSGNHISLTRNLLTLALVWFAWAFFRAHSGEQALSIVGQMLNVASFSLQELDVPSGKCLALMILFFVHHIYVYRREKLGRSWAWVETDRSDAILTGIMLSLCFLIPGTGNVFIYFQF